MLFIENLNPFMVEYLLFFFLCFLIGFCVLLFENKKWGFPVLVSNVSIFCQFVFLAVIYSFIDSSNVGFSFFNDVAVFDAHSSILRSLLLVVGFGTVIFTKFYTQKKKIFQYEYLVFFVFSLLGLSVLCVSFDFLSIYLAIELQSLSFYILAIFFWNSEYNLESGLKYFVLGSLMSCLFLLGFALI
jgi:NADH-quinone oxidoreductase subunit N